MINVRKMHILVLINKLYLAIIELKKLSDLTEIEADIYLKLLNLFTTTIETLKRNLDKESYGNFYHPLFSNESKINILYSSGNKDKLDILKNYLNHNKFGRILDIIFDITISSPTDDITEGTTSLAYNAKLKSMSAVKENRYFTGYVIGDDTGLISLALTNNLNFNNTSREIYDIIYPGAISKRISDEIHLDGVISMLGQGEQDTILLKNKIIKLLKDNEKLSISDRNILVLLVLLSEIENILIMKESDDVALTEYSFNTKKEFTTYKTNRLSDITKSIGESILVTHLHAINNVNGNNISSVGTMKGEIDLAQYSIYTNSLTVIKERISNSIGYNNLFNKLNVKIQNEKGLNIKDIIYEHSQILPNCKAFTNIFIEILSDFNNSI